MHAIKIHNFKKINQLNIETENLVCNKCGNWLTTTIYYSQELSYCEDCCPSAENALRNKPHQDIFANFKFPCKYENCDAVESCQTIKKHQLSCKHKSVKCLHCDSKNVSELSMADHLMTNHADITILVSIKEPIAVLILSTPIKPVTNYVINLNTNKFVVFVKHINNNLLFATGKQQDYEDVADDVYKIEYISETNDVLAKIKGKTSSFAQCEKLMQDELIMSSRIIPEHAPKEENLLLQISFNKYKSIGSMLLNECPICMNPFTLEVYQCINGHNTCNQCGPKLNKCPTCRTPVIHNKFNLRDILRNVTQLCKYFDKGCLKMLNSSHMDDHLAVCAYKGIKCVKCSEKHSKLNLIRHMKDKHAGFISLQYLCCEMKNGCIQETIDHIMFNDEIFRFSKNVAVNENNGCFLSFKVCLMCSSEYEEAQKYRYEIHILDKSLKDIAEHKIGSICQPATDDRVTCSIYICEKDIIASQDKYWTRYCVFKND